MKLEIVSLPGEEVNIAALHYIPEKDRQPTALLFAHGFIVGDFVQNVHAFLVA